MTDMKSGPARAIKHAPPDIGVGRHLKATPDARCDLLRRGCASPQSAILASKFLVNRTLGLCTSHTRESELQLACLSFDAFSLLCCRVEVTWQLHSKPLGARTLRSERP